MRLILICSVARSDSGHSDFPKGRPGYKYITGKQKTGPLQAKPFTWAISWNKPDGEINSAVRTKLLNTKSICNKQTNPQLKMKVHGIYH